MITPEQADTHLKKIVRKSWLKDGLARADQVAAPLQRHIRSILSVAAKPQRLFKDWETYKEALRRAALELDALSATERVAVFDRLVPKMGKLIESAWQRQKCGPYQVDHGGERKPFRVPSQPEFTASARGVWLHQLTIVANEYPGQTLPWFAAWVPHLPAYSSPLNDLFAAALDERGPVGDEVFEVLTASAKGEHEIGVMGRHVIRTLLVASRPEGWKFIEKMLLAAQREEGLRQSILETVDESHPEAFRRMLSVIVESKLARFSAVVRAADVWFGYRWDSVSVGVVNQILERVLSYLDDDKARAAALSGNDPEQVYLALWTLGFNDAGSAVPVAARLLNHPKVEHRYVAAHLLAQVHLPVAQEALLAVFDDIDLRVTNRALAEFQHHSRLDAADLFERLEKLLPRFPKKAVRQAALVWPWTECKISQSAVASCLLSNLGEHPGTRLLPYAELLDPQERSRLVLHLGEQKQWDAATRQALLRFLGDASSWVRGQALQALITRKVAISAEEAERLAALLTRSAGDLRRGVLALLVMQADSNALVSADRLLVSPSAAQRLAGLELLRQLTEAKRSGDACRARAEQYRATHPTVNDAERHQLDVLAEHQTATATLDDALGLLKPEERTWPDKPVARKVTLHSRAALALLIGLDDLIHEHRHTPVKYSPWGRAEIESLLGDIGQAFPRPWRPGDAYYEGDAEAELPLRPLWEDWWQCRGQDLRDQDRLEAWRAKVYLGCALWDFSFVGNPDFSRTTFKFQKKHPDAVAAVLGREPRPKLRYPRLLRALLEWFVEPLPGLEDFLLDAAETAFATVPAAEVGRVKKDWRDTTWREDESPFQAWVGHARAWQKRSPTTWTAEQIARLWRLLRWFDEPLGRATDAAGKPSQRPPRERPDIDLVILARDANAATDADVLDALLGPRSGISWRGVTFMELTALTRRGAQSLGKKPPWLNALLDGCRERILEIELTRGDTPTVASDAAMSLSSIWGTDNLIAILRALGSREFVRGGLQGSASKEASFSHLTRCCFPLAGESDADFKAQVQAVNLSEQRLVELAVYAPQWATRVEHALGWSGLTDAVWWIHAHTKGSDWTVDAEIREVWQADVSQRTALTPLDLLDGAVDVAWFHVVRTQLGHKRWEQLYAAAKFASSGAGHARARLFADAMLGEVSRKELIARITQKRHQDPVRALGLLPLAKGKSREVDLLERYKVMQELIRTSRQFGSQRQASEKRAAQIGQENLARTAGYPDPLRLQWAMEARDVADLADGPISLKAGGITVSLDIDPRGEIELTMTKDGKVLSDFPPALKKDKKIAALRARQRELKRQASRIRGALEQFMCRGEGVTGAELQDLMKHPLLAPMLDGLVLVGDGVLGYPVKDGKALEDYAGNKEALRKDETVRIAHPVDLLPAATWHEWQKECFARERIQPFKQVFRELYGLTKSEKDDGTQSRRYAGHQVQPRKALALLGTRGWVHHPEEGVRKTYHDAGITAWLEFDEPFLTPAEVEGLTLEAVHFTRREGDGKPLKLTTLPPRLFSETMRDLDLVVSVAHRGGVDPEATASTLEMRAAVVKETCALLKFTNVQLKGNFALIKGELAEYSVHLGSAMTRKMPGEALFIISVQAQHRGRLFLPFVDNDPRTAEVVSKVLLLARDKEIKDPNILEQIRH